MNYKDFILNYLESDYKFLYECAYNISKKKETAHELLSELTIYLVTNYKKMEALEDNPNHYTGTKLLQSFSVSWIKLQNTYATTPFRKKHALNNLTDDYTIKDEVIEFDFDFEDEYLNDLRDTYTDNQIDKIKRVNEIVSTMNEAQQFIFRAYFLEGLSYEKIKDKYKFTFIKNNKRVFYKSKQHVFQQMKIIKEKIKKEL